MADAGGPWRPHILTDFRCQHQIRQFLTGQQNVSAKPACLSRHPGDLPGRSRAFCKMPHLVEFRIVGNERLGNECLHLSLIKHGSHVIQPPVHLQRQSHERQEVFSLGLSRQRQQFFLCPAQQHLLQKQVAARIAGEAKLREHHDGCSGTFCLFHSLSDLVCIVCHVPHPDGRGHRSSPYESMSHWCPPIFSSKSLSARLP